MIQLAAILLAIVLGAVMLMGFFGDDDPDLYA